MIKRESCAICESKDFEKLRTFKEFPVYMGAKKVQLEYFEDQNWVICKNCGCVQLSDLVDLEILYKVPHNPAIGKTWEKHNQEFAKFCDSILKKGECLEVGGGNFKIFNLLSESGFDNYTIYDSHIYGEVPDGVEVKKDFIVPNDFNRSKKYDTIIMSHVFEHFYNPREFVKLFYEILNQNGRVLISFPNSTNMVRDFYPNGLCFEHTFQLDIDLIERLMSEEGFYLEKFENFSDHNVFVSFQKSDKNLDKKHLSNYKKSKKNFLEYLNYYEVLAKMIDKISNYKDVYLFGCHIFSQMLLESGLSEHSVKGILDNDVGKQGDTMYGTGLKVFNPSVISDKDGSLIVVKCGVYSEEISNQIKGLNRKCEILL